MLKFNFNLVKCVGMVINVQIFREHLSAVFASDVNTALVDWTSLYIHNKNSEEAGLK